MTVPELNKILARELGHTPFGDEGLYQWDWSEDLWWPAVFTGHTIEKRTPGGIIYMEREYTRTRMTNKCNTWIITKWTAPDMLTDWQVNFPGAPYPARGVRIHSDYYNRPGVVPTFEDTQVLIHLLRNQLGDYDPVTKTFRQSQVTAANDMFEKMQDDERAELRREIHDEVRDTFTAFLNPTPGKRGGEVSMPSLQRDIILPPDAKAN